LLPAPAAGVTGAQKVLVVLATWGPQPFERQDVRRIVFEEANGFLRRASYGQLWLEGDVTPWSRVIADPAGCPDDWWAPRIARSVADPARAAARAAGYRLADYDRFVYLVPAAKCAFDGVGWSPEILLNGRLNVPLLVHELGHTWGLAHAWSAHCLVDCPVDEYGDAYSVMGDGVDDFSIFEKLALGWRVPVIKATKTGTFSIARADRRGTRPKALRVPVAGGEFWLEYRPAPLYRESGEEPLEPGVLVRYVNPREAARPLGPPAMLLLEPAGRSRAALAGGQTFRAPGRFSVRFASASGGRAALRFTWTDRLAPTDPEIVEPSFTVAAGSPLSVSWGPSEETGSGIAHYLVSVDGKAPRKVLRRDTTLRGTEAGVHRVTVVAIDRAGNRSGPGVRQFEVVRR
jgi:hypothetical protein